MPGLKFTKEDLTAALDKASAAWQRLSEFKKNNQEILNQWQELEAEWESEKFSLAEIAVEISQQNGLLVEDEVIEVRIKDHNAIIFPKELYGEKKA